MKNDWIVAYPLLQRKTVCQAQADYLLSILLDLFDGISSSKDFIHIYLPLVNAAIVASGKLDPTSLMSCCMVRRARNEDQTNPYVTLHSWNVSISLDLVFQRIF